MEGLDLDRVRQHWANKEPEPRRKSTSQVRSAYPGGVGPYGLIDPHTSGFRTGLGMNDIVELCEEERKRANVVQPLHTVERYLKEQVNTEGLALHLLHLQKLPRIENGGRSALKSLLDGLLKDSVRVNIFKENDLSALVVRRAPTSECLLLPEDRVDGHPQCIGIYLVSRGHLECRVAELKTSLHDWKEVVPKDWLDSNVLVRMKCTGRLHDSMVLKCTPTSAYVKYPSDFAFQVNKFLEACGGRLCLARLFKKLKQHYDMPLKHASLLLEISSSQNKEPLKVNANSPWIFYRNAESLPRKDTEFVGENIDKTLFRRLEDYLSYHGKEMSDVAFAKESYLAFPYPCGLRKKADLGALCSDRFTSMRKKDVHVEKDHNISAQELALIKGMEAYWADSGNIRNELLFLEERGLLDEFEISRLRQKENLKSTVEEFMQIQACNLNIVQEMSLLLKRFKDSPVLQSQKADILNLCESHLNYLKSHMLKHEVLSKYLTAWMSALNLQCSVLTGMNDLKQRIRENTCSAKTALDAVMSDMTREISRAGQANVGAVRPDAALQHLASERSHSSLYGLALVSSMASIDDKRVSEQLSAYTNAVAQKRKRDPDPDGSSASCKPAAFHSVEEDLPKKAKFQPELVILQPLELRTELADFRDHIVITLNEILGPQPQQLTDLAKTMEKLLHSMFVFTEDGRQVVYEAVITMLFKVREKHKVQGGDFKQGLWIAFCRMHECLNRRIEQLGFLLKVRLAKSEDKSRRPFKYMQRGYDVEEKKSAKEISAFAEAIPSEDILLTPSGVQNVGSLLKEHEMLSVVRDAKKLQMIVTSADLEEVNHLRSRLCPICYDQFSTRPLECLNCTARRIEADHENLCEEELLRILSHRIEAVPASSSIDHTGGHVFHKDCIRRHIQLQALNPSAAAIACPICRADIYNKLQKQTILDNIHMAALKISIGLSDNDERLRSDDMINMKRKEPVPGGLEYKMKEKHVETDLLQKYIKVATMPLKGKNPVNLFEEFDEKPNNVDQAEYVMKSIKVGGPCVK